MRDACGWLADSYIQITSSSKQRPRQYGLGFTTSWDVAHRCTHKRMWIHWEKMYVIFHSNSLNKQCEEQRRDLKWKFIRHLCLLSIALHCLCGESIYVSECGKTSKFLTFSSSTNKRCDMMRKKDLWNCLFYFFQLFRRYT